MQNNRIIDSKTNFDFVDEISECARKTNFELRCKWVKEHGINRGNYERTKIPACFLCRRTVSILSQVEGAGNKSLFGNFARKFLSSTFTFLRQIVTEESSNNKKRFRRFLKLYFHGYKHFTPVYTYKSQLTHSRTLNVVSALRGFHFRVPITIARTFFQQEKPHQRHHQYYLFTLLRNRNVRQSLKQEVLRLLR